jgi:branched-chain amino acid transport system ATP-binding protein
MLAIGRALMTNPAVLMCDEATEGLAPLLRRAIWTCLGTLRELGQAALIVDRSTEALTALADRHYILERGQVVWSGASREFEADPSLRERYLAV